MKKLLLPLILMIVGTGGGVGAAMFLAPPEEEMAEDDLAHCPPPQDSMPTGDTMVEPVSLLPEDEPDEGVEYARLNNQFIVPVVENDRMTALVVMTISVEVTAGQKDAVFAREPRLRDGFLQVLFDHANQGGFDGVFTASENMGNLRTALRNVARNSVGPDVRDVLILDLVRQEIPG